MSQLTAHDTSEMTDYWSELLSDVSPDGTDISDVPVYEPQRDIFAIHKRKQWDKSGMQHRPGTPCFSP